MVLLISKTKTVSFTPPYSHLSSFFSPSNAISLLLSLSVPSSSPCRSQDLRLALALGDKVEQPLPVAAAANEVFKRGRAQGLGDQDFSAVLEAVKGSASSTREDTL